MPDERYRVIPVPMPNAMVWELIESYVDAAGRLADADLDGVEILACMGYLVAAVSESRNQSPRLTNLVATCRKSGMRFSARNHYPLPCPNRLWEQDAGSVRITLDEKTDKRIDCHWT